MKRKILSFVLVFVLAFGSVLGGNNAVFATEKTVSVKNGNLASATVTASKQNYTYTGKQIKPSVTVKYGGKKLKNGTDYTVKYSSNKSTGKGCVTVNGKGNYNGSKKFTFYIVPKAPTVSLKSAGSTSLKIKWKNVSGKSGYRLAYKKKTDKKFKTVTVSKNEKTLTELSKGTSYSVKVCAYKTVNGVKHYGSWSAVKSYKTTGKSTSQTKQTVYITSSGKKYHLNKNCRGLANAKSVSGISLSKAKSQGYTLCGFE